MSDYLAEVRELLHDVCGRRDEWLPSDMQIENIVERAVAELEQARETNKRLEAQLAENDAKALALRVALEKANVELD